MLTKTADPKPGIPWKRKLLLLSLTTLVCLAALEVGLRIVAPPIQRGIGTRDTPKAQLYGWAMPPHFRHGFVNPDTGQLHVVTTNSEGWKDVEHSFHKPAGTRRILFLGSSFTWGYVPLEELYTRQVERLFHDRGRTNVEVISIGVGAWGTDQCLEALTQEGLRYHPDVVIYQLGPYDVVANVTPKSKPFQYELAADGSLKRVELHPPREDVAWQRRVKDLLLNSALVYNLNTLRHNVGRFYRTGSAARSASENRQFSHELGNPLGPHFLYADSPEQESKEMRAAWKILDGLLGKMKQTTWDNGADFLVFAVCGDPCEYRREQAHHFIESAGGRDCVLVDGQKYPADYQRPLKNLEAICAARRLPLIKPVKGYERYHNDPHTNKNGNLGMASDVVAYLELREALKAQSAGAP
jgi:hypothetical protein